MYTEFIWTTSVFFLQVKQTHMYIRNISENRLNEAVELYV